MNASSVRRLLPAMLGLLLPSSLVSSICAEQEEVVDANGDTYLVVDNTLVGTGTLVTTGPPAADPNYSEPSVPGGQDDAGWMRWRGGGRSGLGGDFRRESSLRSGGN